MPDRLSHLRPAGEVLDRYRAAAVAQSVDDMARLYAVDAVHEFPFSRPGLPTVLSGRDTIMEFVAGGWRNGPLEYARYETVVAYATDDPSTIVVQQNAHGTSSATGDFVLPNLMIVTVRDGEITHLRDFVDVLAALDAIGAGP
ncbi:nuclear transport factor 2 family protein [Pseudonocardia endophytica]|uniref:Ketosteroid isomerase-like protein n=1 Tax=Pseudonocardia endophytica TaxID=401976 RepID=A0A4V2PJ72_PSEEN|nr:nuclear transport factor 2 family protein [Pseudonocardia endophytica]TCK27336.1 ketosteroid isomerase-like protein [Pseudonocardia endophytica]